MLRLVLSSQVLQYKDHKIDTFTYKSILFETLVKQ